jgi:uncharacterized protein (DUF169 family)
MNENVKSAAEFISNNLRLKTMPVAVKFLKEKKDFPEKTRQPSTFLGKKITLCQAITMARLYGWTVRMTKDDIICVPAAIAFGFSNSTDTVSSLTRLLCTASYSANEEAAGREAAAIKKLENGEYEGIVFSPLQKTTIDPDTVLFYGNPAQMMRLIQAWSYGSGQRVHGNFGGKVECTEYLLVPFKEQIPRVSIPGTGDRVFSMT